MSAEQRTGWEGASDADLGEIFDAGVNQLAYYLRYQRKHARAAGLQHRLGPMRREIKRRALARSGGGR